MEGGQMVRETRVPEIEQITEVTDLTDLLVGYMFPGTRVTKLPSGLTALVKPLFMLYVFRCNGQARMIVNRVDPFQFEQMVLTDLEMDLVISWAHKMVANDIGRFTPDDGGWMWWRK